MGETTGTPRPDVPGDGVQYEVVLRHIPGGPAVIGLWSDPGTAERKFTRYLGLYSAPGVTVRLFEVAPDGTRRLLRRWP